MGVNSDVSRLTLSSERRRLCAPRLLRRQQHRRTSREGLSGLALGSCFRRKTVDRLPTMAIVARGRGR